MSLFKCPVVVVDTETTGLLKHSWARVVEIGAVLLDMEGYEVSTFERLIWANPPPEADEALRINHITREQLLAAPQLDDVIGDFLDWVGPHPATAFNVAFDRAMLERSHIKLRWGPCVMQAARQEFGEPINLKRAVTRYQVPEHGPAHRALADARMAAGVLVALRRRGAI